jgi:hypothetical protein
MTREVLRQPASAGSRTGETVCSAPGDRVTGAGACGGGPGAGRGFSSSPGLLGVTDDHAVMLGNLTRAHDGRSVQNPRVTSADPGRFAPRVSSSPVDATANGACRSRAERLVMGTIRAYERASPLAHAQGSPMLPEVRPHVSAALAHRLEHQLGLASRLEAAHLDVEGVAGIAVVAAAHCDGQLGGHRPSSRAAGRPACPHRSRRTLLVGPVEVFGHRLPATRQHQSSGSAFSGRRRNRPGPADPLGR